MAADAMIKLSKHKKINAFTLLKKKKVDSTVEHYFHMRTYIHTYVRINFKVSIHTLAPIWFPH